MKLMSIAWCDAGNNSFCIRSCITSRNRGSACAYCQLPFPSAITDANRLVQACLTSTRTPLFLTISMQ